MKKVLINFLIVLFVVPFSVRAKAPENKSIEVISFNIRTGEGKDGTNSWRFRYPATIELVKKENPDVMGLQEAMKYQEGMILYDCSDYKAIGVGRENGKKLGESMSILYNKKTISVSKWGTFWLSENPSKPSTGWDAACRRTATWALMKSKDSKKKFFCVNTHLDHEGSLARKNGIKLILEKINELNKQNLPVILMGDFNVLSYDPSLKELNDEMSDSRKVAIETDDLHTFNGWGKSKKIIDYIYFKGFSKCTEFQTIQKKYAGRPFISDHFPIRAKLEF